MAQFDVQKNVLIGPYGQLEISLDDEIIHKFLMLQEGECDGPGPLQAAAKFGFSKQRYYQLRTVSDHTAGLWLLIPEHLRWLPTQSTLPRNCSTISVRSSRLTSSCRCPIASVICVVGSRFLRRSSHVTGQGMMRSTHKSTAVVPFMPHDSRNGPYFELVQRRGERSPECEFNSFLSTTDCDPVEALTVQYPKRWHIEEYYNFDQSLGWRRAGTMNINIRYGQMTMALLAQTVIHQFRRRLGGPFDTWDAQHLASAVFRDLEGDVRVRAETIVVTYYNAPKVERLRE